ncbi:MAG: phosphopantetheine-binding protein [Eubacteriales bacterium]|nr:phosphopantetheine-binding protein [Eubacteriales bacterium]MDD3349324.1 phosphopantetheine-binding protein [Eubacteriales bacterium]
MTLEKIAKIIAETRDMDATDIKRETSFEEMELDSLDVVEVIMAIEEEFNITIEGADDLKSVGELVDLVESLK